MRLYPTRAAFRVAVAGIGLVTLGAAARLPAVVAFGGAMLLAIAFGRAVARVGINRLRSAGFEMVWSDGPRVRRMARGATLVVRGELRNRSADAVRALAIRPIASSMLRVSVHPPSLELPPRSRAPVDLVVEAPRTGRWGLHGLALEVSVTPFEAEGAYEIPLLFANPLGIEVLPPASLGWMTTARGGRARLGSSSGRPERALAQGDELRELREYVPGDPLKRIAWKATARRGRTLVREMEHAERHIIWLVLDASVELWAGPLGAAPLDHVVDEVASMTSAHLRGGDRVGLVIVASRLRAWIAPAAGLGHGAVLAGALANAAATIDADRSELDEAEVARLVAEHARPLDPGGLGDLPRGDLDALAARAERIRAQAPFSPRVPYATTRREQTLRHYLASFGIESAPRAEGERLKTELTLAYALERITAERPRASIVHVWAPPPLQPDRLAKPIASLRTRGVEVRWTLPPFDAGVDDQEDGNFPGGDRLTAVVADAVRIRVVATHERSERVLRALGVRVVGHRPRRRRPPGRPARIAAPPPPVR